MYESSNVENVEKVIAISDFSELRFTSLRDNNGNLVGGRYSSVVLNTERPS